MPDADARAQKILNARLWHFTSIGMGNCRAAQNVRREIERQQPADALTNAATERTRNPSTLDPLSAVALAKADHPLVASKRGEDGLALNSIDQLAAGLSHLTAIGMANSRAAQKVRQELSRRLLIQSAFLANADFDSNEPRDHSTGEWTTGGNSAAAGTNSPPQLSTEAKVNALLDAMLAPKSETYLTPSSTMQGIGGMLDWFGEKFRDYEAARIFSLIGDDEDALKQLGFTSDQLKQMGFKDVEEDSGTTGEKPFEQGMQTLPPAAQAASRAAEGIVKSAPRVAIAEANPVLGALAFGTTPDGFNPKLAIMAAALPLVGKYSGEIVEAMAAKAGVSSDTALQAFNKIGGAAGVTSLIGADQLNQIMKLPPDKRKQALIEAGAVVGAMIILGIVTGGGKRDSLGDWVDENGGGFSEKDNIQRGQNAMDRAIRQKTDVQKAMYRKGIGQIDFIWGRPGTNLPDENGRTHADGYGISHLIAKHGEDVARQLPEVLAKGKVMPHPESADKILVEYNNQVVSLWRESNTKAWVITSFERQAGR